MPSHIHAMPYHRFKVGQTVVAPFGGPHALIPRGPHVIMRLLPLVGDEPQYRMQSTADGRERIVTEGLIKPVEQPPKIHDQPPSKPKTLRRHR